jgi:CDP-diacylglycerol--glycerol-3-phosphate 3-phosphatidyltransferase
LEEDGEIARPYSHGRQGRLNRRPIASARVVVIPTVSRSSLRSARLLAAGTTLRIFLTPIVMWLVIADGNDLGDADSAAAVLFVVAAATDWIDGRLARRWGVTTKLGSFLDTTADKLLVSGVLIALLAIDRVSPWIVGVIIGRELVMMGLRGVIATEGSVMQPSLLGKLKTSVQFLALLLAILRPGDPIAGAFADEWVMFLAAAISVCSAIDYLARELPALVAPLRRG